MLHLKKRTTRMAATILAAATALGTIAAAAGIVLHKDTVSVYAEEPYFSKTTYYSSKDDFYSQVEKATGTALLSTPATYSENADEEYVVGVTKEVWSEETYDEDGMVAESKLLTKSEMDERGIDPDSPSPLMIVPLPVEGGGGGGSTETTIGTDTTALYKLTIYLEVLYNSSTKQYTANGTAHWDSGVSITSGKKYAENDELDMMAITWAGGSSFKYNSSSTSGTYSNGNEIQIAQTKYIVDAGLIWSFQERTDTFWAFGYIADEVNATTLLTKKNSSDNECTIKFTYIHTYNEWDIDPELTFEVGYDGGLEISVGAGLNFSLEDNLWQIEVFVTNI